MMILSGDPPRSRALTLILVAIIAALAITPLVFPGAKAMNVAAKICIFAALVASYDLLLKSRSRTLARLVCSRTSWIFSTGKNLAMTPRLM